MAKTSSKQVIAKQRRDLINDLLSRCTCPGAVSDDALDSILTLINNIIVVETQLDQVPLPSRDGHFDEFLTFCQANGVDVSAVEVCKSMAGYGLKAKKEIAENELMLTIPRQMLLTVEHSASEVPFTTFITQDPLLKEMPNLLLAMILIREYCDSNSRWKPYFNILPDTYETPLYFDRETLWSLKPSPSFQEAGKLIRNIGRQYAYFWTKMNSTNHVASQLSFRHQFTFQIYRWAVCTVMTRQNLVPVPSCDEERQVNALIPLWDLCNHNWGKFSTDYSFEKDAVLCYAMETFKFGEEIKIQYGTRNNEEFLIHNGFVPSNNPHNYLRIALGISKNDKLANMRTSLCVKAQCSSNSSFKLRIKSAGLDPELICFLRIFHMDADLLQHWLENEDPTELKNALSTAFERLDEMSRNFLKIRASLLLRSYPSDDDIMGINNSDIRTLLLGEKEILQSHVV